MMRLWGSGTGLLAAAPCPLGQGRVRPVRGMRPNRCQRRFANSSEDGEASPSPAMMICAWPLLGGPRRHDTYHATGKRLSRIRDSIRPSYDRDPVFEQRSASRHRLRPRLRFEHQRDPDSRTRHSLVEGSAFSRGSDPTSRRGLENRTRSSLDPAPPILREPRVPANSLTKNSGEMQWRRSHCAASGNEAATRNRRHRSVAT